MIPRGEGERPEGGGPPPDTRLDVLGGTDLSRDGVPVSAVLAQPKRLALLVYLLLARPGSFQRRDHLLGLFWPASTPPRARANLRQAIRFLRRSLGDGVIVRRGDGEVGIGEGALSCDALELRRALDDGDLESALELYGGELLPGLFVSHAPDFERWLSAERRALKEATRDGAIALSESAESNGRLSEAIDWARTAAALDPLDERSSRQWIRLLGRAGRRAEAVAIYESLRSRLTAELEVRPSPETEALVKGFRGDGADHPPAPSPTKGPHLDSRRVLVLPYRDRTGSSKHHGLGGLVADWIAQGLARNPELSVVPPMVVKAAGVPDGPAAADPDEPLPGLAEEMGAGTVVAGAVEIRDQEIVFRTSILDVADRRLLPPPDPVFAPTAEPLSGLQRLRDVVSGCLAPLLTTQPVHARRADRPPSFEAYRAYLDGLDHFVGGDWRRALREFGRAVDEEWGYALPRVVSAIALWNLGRLPEAVVVAQEAEALRSSLGPFERGALDMVLGWLRGDWRAAYRGARHQAEVAPGSLASVQVAEEARRLNHPREALNVLAALDPDIGELRGWVFYWLELCTAHHLLGNHRAELAAARRGAARHPGHALVHLAELRALAALGESEALGHLGYRILATPPGGSPSPGALLRRAALELQAHGHDEDAVRFLEMSEEWWREQRGIPDPMHRRERALTLYHRGRLEEAREILRNLVEGSDGALPALDEHHGHLRGHLDEGYLALIADRLGDGEETAHWLHVLEDLDDPLLYGARWLWLAALAGRVGDIDRGVSHLRRALIDGLPFSLALHTDPDLEPLRGHPGFEGILAPKG